MLRKFFTGCCLLAFLLPLAAWAQQGVGLVSRAEVEIKVKNAKGEEEIQRIPAANANVGPGDAVIFTNHYVNRGEKPADNIVVTNPVPENMLYVDGSASGENARIEFSVDGGKTYGAPETLIFTDAEGRERPVRTTDFTHIRWTLTASVPPGGEGEVAFRARIR